MDVLEIFKTENGEMMYTETKKICYDSLGSWVPANFAIRVVDLAGFLAMSDDEEIVLSPDCPERDPRLIPLKPSHKASDVDSLVVFDAWREKKTPAVALYERDSDGKLTFKRVYPVAEEIPQGFWEIWYPSVCARISAKVREYFQLHANSCSHSYWYFVGRNTQTLYIVIRQESLVMTYNDYCGIETTKNTSEIGASDGLNLDALCKVYESYGFKIDALEGTDYYSRAVDTPEDIMNLAHSNSDVETILKRLLTEDEWSLL